MNRPLHKIGATGEKKGALDVVILCGGQGTRLRPLIHDVPKVLAPVSGRPFLSLVLERVRAQGFRRIILAVGYKAGMIKNHFKNRTKLVFSEECEPLGTGGAAKQALSLAQTPHSIIINGDTLCPVDLRDVIRFHLAREGVMTMVVTEASRHDAGSIVLDEQKRIVSFKEKEGGAARYINAGIYIFRADVLAHMPAVKSFSLEYDFFPSLISEAPCYGYVTEETAVDIGTPERYERAVREISLPR